MKKLSLNQMEQIQGGQREDEVSLDCGLSIAGALLFGTGAIIGAATGGIGAIAFAMAGNYFAWGMTARTCSKR